MRNRRKKEPALPVSLLELRFAEKKHGFWVFFRHEVPILAGCRAVGPLCTVGFRDLPKIDGNVTCVGFSTVS
jgi:hypothetical protein